MTLTNSGLSSTSSAEGTSVSLSELMVVGPASWLGPLLSFNFTFLTGSFPLLFSVPIIATGSCDSKLSALLFVTGSMLSSRPALEMETATPPSVPSGRLVAGAGIGVSLALGGSASLAPFTANSSTSASSASAFSSLKSSFDWCVDVLFLRFTTFLGFFGCGLAGGLASSVFAFSVPACSVSVRKDAEEFGWGCKIGDCSSSVSWSLHCIGTTAAITGFSSC
mmetsp:Transcript_44313/g.77771  ORF Transcript_44313/g.77771 Transcript_44313/m.77771 type:complete len:222 (+) Transcript_44313:269-934(+)